ncbi:MAG: MBL fold metallo-hydrolase [Clostridia bacterium]|nr:MBL fold metallo-hydrolase [Clostridia bacterium]
MNKSKTIIIVLIVALLFSSCSLYFNQEASLNNSSPVSGEAVFHFIDVGQGDCVFIQAENKCILIDAGTEQSGSTVYKYLKSLDVNYIDYFIGTHPHEDHMGGASAVLSSIDVGTIFINGEASSSYFYEKFIDTLIKKDITPKIPDMDCIYEIGQFRLKFLSPKKDFGNENDNSLVFSVQFGEVKALFMGDAERSVEAELLGNKKELDSDILKVGHHASRYASSSAFLNAVSPSVSVIQCGEGNSYGHPHDEALERLEDASSGVFRTDKDKTVILKTDGKTVKKVDGEEFEKTDSSTLEIIYIGNKKSKVFHCEACANLPSDKNRFDFLSREDALNSGYKPCGNCNP